MSTNPSEIHAKLMLLQGDWHGHGKAQFPTIESAEYREELTFTSNDTELLLHYELKSWQIDGSNEKAKPLSWQSGFLIVAEDGLVQLLNAQNAPRVEVLTGRLQEESSGKFKLDLISEIIAYDERMRHSRRIFTFDEHELSYQMYMSTSMVEEMKLHLECKLAKQSG